MKGCLKTGEKMKVAFLFLVAASFALGNAWEIDASHSVAKFKVRHLGISNVYGQITGFKGSVTADEKDATKFSTEVSLDVKTINTNDAKRDAHLKNPDFFDAEKYPTINFKSKKATKKGAGLNVTGDLTMHGVTKEVTLENVEITNPIKDPWGNTRRGFSGLLKVNRKDFGITWNKVLDGGGLAVGDTVEVNIEAELLAPKTATKG